MVGVSSGGRLGPLGALFARGTFGGKTDAELLEHFAAGDAAEMAFEALVARHGPDVMSACRRVLPDPNDAEDAFQATFLVLARAHRGIDRPVRSRSAPGCMGSPSGWPARRGSPPRVGGRHEGRVAGRPDAGFRLPSTTLRTALREEVDRLPEPLRTPVVLCYLEEMAYRVPRAGPGFRGHDPGAAGQGSEPPAFRLGRTEEIRRPGERTTILPARPPRVPSGPGRRDDPLRDGVRPGRGGPPGPLGGRRRTHGRSPDDDARDPMIFAGRDLASLGLAVAGGAAIGREGG